jgi:hypothetical protein
LVVVLKVMWSPKRLSVGGLDLGVRSTGSRESRRSGTREWSKRPFQPPQELPIGPRKTAVGRFLRVTRRRNGSARAVEVGGCSSAGASGFAGDRLFMDPLLVVASSGLPIHHNFSFLQIVVFS